jgi:hypothetical protein
MFLIQLQKRNEENRKKNFRNISAPQQEPCLLCQNATRFQNKKQIIRLTAERPDKMARKPTEKIPEPEQNVQKKGESGKTAAAA